MVAPLFEVFYDVGRDGRILVAASSFFHIRRDNRNNRDLRIADACEGRSER